MNRDPIGEEGGLNLYGILSNDGVNKLDPDGRCEEGYVEERKRLLTPWKFTGLAFNIEEAAGKSFGAAFILKVENTKFSFEAVVMVCCVCPSDRHRDLHIAWGRRRYTEDINVTSIPEIWDFTGSPVNGPTAAKILDKIARQAQKNGSGDDLDPSLRNILRDVNDWKNEILEALSGKVAGDWVGGKSPCENPTAHPPDTNRFPGFDFGH